MLNLLCGPESRLPVLQAGGQPGEWAAWSDPVCQGPAPAGLSQEAWRRVRASFVARTWLLPFGEAHRRLVMEDELVARLDEWDELVIWAGPDPWAQTALIHLLARIGELESVSTPLSLADETGQRRPITAELISFAAHAWTAFTAPAPAALAELAASDHPELPALSSALRRLLLEYPGTDDGLSLTERWVLEELAAESGTTRELSRRVRAREQYPWLDDMMFDAILLQLMGGSRPLISAGRWPTITEFPSATLVLTAAGQAVLSRRADQVRLNGVDRWIGGVHLAGLDAFWRWNRAAGKLVSGR
ncbi:MAG TPA: hypothetical protein VFL95_02745 [Gemmatimonadales bacterium]|nr:hypothetical protein [Gemmatimonadales bacterium]